MTLPDRFWAKVDRSGECWLYQTPSASRWYGSFDWHGRTHHAHRFAYERLIGPIPNGLQLDHLCRNRACVNPAHLEPVTRRENLIRGAGFPGREARATHCPKGHPYSGENLIYRPKFGDRQCRTCKNEYQRLWWQRTGKEQRRVRGR